MIALPTVLSFLVVFILVLTTLRRSSIQGDRSVVERSPKFGTAAQVEDVVIKNGVYSNLKYGFRFKYPESILNYQLNYGNETIVFSSLPLSSYGYGNDFNREGLTFSVSTIHEASVKNEFIENLSRMDMGTKVITAVESKEKLETKEINGVEIITYRVESLPGAETGEIHLYGAKLDVENTTFLLELIANQKSKLEENKMLFSNIVDSITFF